MLSRTPTRVSRQPGASKCTGASQHRARLRQRLFTPSLVLICALGLTLGSCRKNPDPIQDETIRMLKESPFLMLSNEANQIVGIDVNRLRTLSIFPDLKKAIVGTGARAEHWEEMAKELGFDPLDRIDDFVLGSYRIVDLENPFAGCIVVFTGSWESDEQLMDAFLTYLGKEVLIDPPPFESKKYRGVLQIFETIAPSRREPDREVGVYFSFPGPGLGVFTMTRDLLPECLDVTILNRPGIRESEDWQRRLDTVQLDGLAWAAGSFPRTFRSYISDKIESEPELQNLKGLTNARQFYLNFQFDRNYLMGGGFICDSPFEAEIMGIHLEKARPILPRILEAWFYPKSPRIVVWQDFFDRTLVTMSADRTKFSAVMDRAEVEHLLGLTMAGPTPTPTPMVIPAPFRKKG